MILSEVVSEFARYIHRINDVDITQMAGLAKGTADATLKTTNPFVYNLYNQQLTKVATDNIPMSACATQIANSFCYYLVSIDIAGTVTVTKNTNNNYLLPSTPAGQVPFGAIKVVTDAVTTFTSDTDDLADPGITATFYDIDTGVARMLINKAQTHMEQGIDVNMHGSQIKVGNWDHMKVRAQITINIGDDSFVNPIPNYKQFINAQLTDAFGYIYPPMKKKDKIHVGLTGLLGRPREISRLPTVEAVFTKDGEPTFEFNIWPVSDQVYTLDLQIYQYSPYLDGVIYSNNWWTDNAPECLVYGALAEGAPYLINEDRMSVWKSLWQERLASLWECQTEEKYAGALINIRFIDPYKRAVGNIYSYTDNSMEDW